MSHKHQPARPDPPSRFTWLQNHVLDSLSQFVPLLLLVVVGLEDAVLALLPPASFESPAPQAKNKKGTKEC